MFPRSTVPDVPWPAVPSAEGALMLALMFQLEESQFLPPEALERRQLDALHRLVDHAARTVPYYRDTFGYAEAAAGPAMTAEQWRRLPVLSRADLQEAGPAIRSQALPSEHEPVSKVVTTGTTGPPVRVLGTRVTGLLWQAITLRDMLWHQRDMGRRLAAIRADRGGQIPPEGLVLPSWAPFLESAYRTGPCAVLGVTQDVATQARWLVEQDPDYLLTYPSNAVALADHFARSGIDLPRLRQVWTYGEVLTAEVRPACARAWGVRVVDMYSCQEIGYLALQCPDAHSYHVQSETAYVEILDGGGQPCRPGQVGRVVVTALHNYATPLLRYELGDYAEMGGPCGCGRSLPVLNRVVGRERNMWVGPDGQRLWPVLPSTAWEHLSAIRQLQLVQHAVDHIEVRVVGPRALSGPEQEELTECLGRHFEWSFQTTFTFLREIDRARAVKHEDFVSLVDR